MKNVELFNRILSLRKSGHTNKEIGNLVGMNENSVRYYSEDYEKNKKTRNLNRRGKRNKVIIVKSVHGSECSCCTYKRANTALEFHHLDSSQKEKTLASMGHNNSLKNILEESKKCVLVCSNCHREIHEGIIDSKTLKSTYSEQKAVTALKEYKEKGHPRKIDDEKLNLITKMISEGKTNKFIGNVVGVSSTMIFRIRHGKKYEN